LISSQWKHGRLSGQPDSTPPPRRLDRYGWSTLVAGALLLHFGTLQISEQIGVGLHLAALAVLLKEITLPIA
jgi:hypothetical protein